MKLPKEIVGRNKIRDAQICLTWERLLDDKNYPTIESIKQAISKQFNLTEFYIYKIVRRNNAYTPQNYAWEKTKRINRLKLEIKNKDKSNKDVADLMEQLRKEIEGDKPLIDQSVKHHIQIINYGGKSNTDSPTGIQRPDTQVAVGDSA